MNEAAVWLQTQRMRRRERRLSLRLLAVEIFLLLMFAAVQSSLRP